MVKRWLVLVVLGFNLEATAQDRKDSLYVNPDNYLLDEMVISANRWEQNLSEIASRVSKISLGEMHLHNPQTAADLVGISQGVFIQKSQLGGGSPVIRGFAANRVLLVIDGVRMNNAIFRSGNVQNIISLDANAIREAEVIFGPGSVIYGSDAIGGVMDFHTLKPRISRQAKPFVGSNALVRYSSANKERTAHADVNIGFKKWAILSSFTRSYYDDLKMGSNGPGAYRRPDYVARVNDADVVVKNADPDVQVPTGYDQLNAMQKIRYQPGSSWELEYAFHYSKTSSYSRYDRLILKDGENFDHATWYYGPQEWQMHTLTVLNDKPTFLKDQVKLTLAYQDYQESRHNRGFGSANRTNRFEGVKAFSMNLDADKALSEATTAFYGGEVIANRVSSEAYRINITNGNTSGTSTRYPDNSDWRTYAAYASVKHRLSSRWLLNASTRFTHVYTHAVFDKTYFDFPFEAATVKNNAVNGSAGIIYNPSFATHWYANISTGFRAPNIDDIGKVFDSQPGYVVVPNPDLDPETAYNAETGVATAIHPKIKVDLALYYTLMDNAIARSTYTFQGADSVEFDGELSRVLALRNIGRVQIYGFQAGLNWQLMKTLRLTSSLNFQKGKEKDPETGRNFSPTHVAPLFGATHLVYKRNKVTADLYMVYNGPIEYRNLALSERADAHLYIPDENGNPYAPSWMTLNLKASWAINKFVTVDGGVENILDKRYRPYSSGIAAAGRNFIIAVRGRL